MTVNGKKVSFVGLLIFLNIVLLQILEFFAYDL